MDFKVFKSHFVKTVIIITLMATIFAIINHIGKQSEYEQLDFSKGWTMYSSKGSQTDVDVTKDSLGLEKRGDAVALLNISGEKINNPALLFRTYHTTVEVYVGNNLIYESGTDRYKEDKVVGCGYHMVSLPDNYYMKNVAIRLIAAEDNPFSCFESMTVVNADEFTSGYVGKNMFGVVTTLFLIVVGFASVMVCLFAGIQKKAFRKIMYIGLISFLIGIWAQCYYGYSCLFCNDDVITYYLEHVSLFVVAFPMLLFIYETVKEGRIRQIIRWLLVASFVFILIVSILHCTNTIHLNEFVKTYHVLAAAIIIITIIAIFTKNIENVNARLSMRVGIICLGLGMFGELVQYNIAIYKGKAVASIHLVPIAGIVYIISTVLANLFILMENLEEQIKQDTLMTMAYGDTLTGLSNRKCCEDKMNEIDRNNVKNYGIINFDLNWLKKINDGLGHVKGDEYLCGFADLLKECCGEKATIGRMGGDEFVAIFENVTQEDLMDVVEEMNRKSGNGNMPETRKIGQGISFAYGCAVSSADFPLSTGKAYEIADEKMYECKKEQKVGRK